MLLGYTIYGITAISNKHKRRFYTAVIFYMTYERMNNHSHNAAYSQLQHTNENASVPLR